MSTIEITSKIEALRELESLIEEAKAEAENLRDEIKADLDKNDLEAVRAKLAQLQQAAQQVYQAQAQQQNQGGTTTNDTDPNVVDATFKEKDNK